MKERPILFNSEMVRALRDGRKTQTRRIVNPQPDFETANNALGGDTSTATVVCDGTMGGIGLKRGNAIGYVFPNIHCPYGMPGDRLWVRETTRMRYLPNFLTGEPTKNECAEYVDGEPVLSPAGFDFSWWYSRKICPSIHMPRWASRITLEVTGVRVERLQDISEADCIDEGIQQWPLGFRVEETGAPDHRSRNFASATSAYRFLWERINGAGSWDANPWVWVVDFRRIHDGV